MCRAEFEQTALRGSRARISATRPSMVSVRMLNANSKARGAGCVGGFTLISVYQRWGKGEQNKNSLSRRINGRCMKAGQCTRDSFGLSLPAYR